MRFREYQLLDSQWGDLFFFQPIPRDGDPWGDFALLRDTEWGVYIDEVTEDALEQAILGRATPLMMQIKNPPEKIFARFDRKEGSCLFLQDRTCITRKPSCRVGEKLPECFTPPSLTGDAAYAAQLIATAWREGRHVIVVFPTS